MKGLLLTLNAALALVAITFWPVQPVVRISDDVILPNSCVITATQAFEKLRPTGVWVQIVLITYVNLVDGTVGGHAVTVWQPFYGSSVLVYDLWLFNSTAQLSSHSRDISTIVSNLQPFFNANKKQIVAARYLN